MRLSSLLAGLLLSIALSAPPAFSQMAGTGIMEYWREPSGSVIAVAPCGADICARLIAISRDAPSALDVHNPDTSLRARPLCSLTIGSGFHLSDASNAVGGKLYDPKSGKTYKGSMTSEGNTLHLRGYVGVKAFGRTEDWVRTGASTAPCH